LSSISSPSWLIAWWWATGAWHSNRDGSGGALRAAACGGTDPQSRQESWAGVADIYNRAKYEAEMRQALERWAEHVQAITFS
jgi:hypothetical protein